MNCTSPLEFFQLFLFDNFIDQLVAQTNLYAYQERSTYGHLSPCSDVTREEILGCLGLNIAMGFVSLQSIRDYWSREPLLAHPWFGTVMSRNRFQQILRYLHMVDNSQAVPSSSRTYDKLWKVRPLIEIINDVSQSNFSLGRELSIDESMIGTKARISFLQYLPKKPTKWGVKVWVLSDSATGYIHKFKIYTGKDDAITHGLAYSVFTELMSELKNKGYHLYMENYYTSPKLVNDLFKDGIYTSGTVRSNRKYFPSELKPEKGQNMVRGDTEILYHDCITAVHWLDKRDVLMLSTIYQNETVNVNRRSGHSMVAVSCPRIVQDYNAHTQ